MRTNTNTNTSNIMYYKIPKQRLQLKTLIQTKFQQKRIKKHQKIKHKYKTNKAFLNQRKVNVVCVHD